MPYTVLLLTFLSGFSVLLHASSETEKPRETISLSIDKSDPNYKPPAYRKRRRRRSDALDLGLDLNLDLRPRKPAENTGASDDPRPSKKQKNLQDRAVGTLPPPPSSSYPIPGGVRDMDIVRESQNRSRRTVESAKVQASEHGAGRGAQHRQGENRNIDVRPSVRRADVGPTGNRFEPRHSSEFNQAPPPHPSSSQVSGGGSQSIDVVSPSIITRGGPVASLPRSQDDRPFKGPVFKFSSDKRFKAIAPALLKSTDPAGLANAKSMKEIFMAYRSAEYIFDPNKPYGDDNKVRITSAQAYKEYIEMTDDRHVYSPDKLNYAYKKMYDLFEKSASQYRYIYFLGAIKSLGRSSRNDKIERMRGHLYGLNPFKIRTPYIRGRLCLWYGNTRYFNNSDRAILLKQAVRDLWGSDDPTYAARAYLALSHLQNKFGTENQYVDSPRVYWAKKAIERLKSYKPEHALYLARAFLILIRNRYTGPLSGFEDFEVNTREGIINQANRFAKASKNQKVIHDVKFAVNREKQRYR